MTTPSNKTLERAAARRTTHGRCWRFAAPRLRLSFQSTGYRSALRPPILRAQRAKTRALQGRYIIAPGKRSGARGNGRTMVSPCFPAGLARRGFAKPAGKQEIAWGVFLPRAAASKALPWAIMRPPRWGCGLGRAIPRRVGEANQGRQPTPRIRPVWFLSILARRRRARGEAAKPASL